MFYKTRFTLSTGSQDSYPICCNLSTTSIGSITEPVGTPGMKCMLNTVLQIKRNNQDTKAIAVNQDNASFCLLLIIFVFIFKHR